MNLLITGAWTDKYIHEIEAMGHRVAFLQQERDLLPCAFDWPEGIICNGLFLYHPLSLFTSLRYIQLTSAGYDRVPMEEVKKRGIEIHNAKGVYSIPMAEFAVAAVLDLYKGMAQYRLQQQRHEWVKNRRARELYGSRVLIVGCGSVGTECAKRFKAFGCRITGVNTTVREDENYDCILPPQALDQELSAADIVILALPLTERTRGLIDAGRLNLIKGILVNISRGPLVDEKALEKWKGTAVLDVFDREPLDSRSPLWDRENTIITPHSSFIGDGNETRLHDLIFENLRHARDTGSHQPYLR